MILRHDFEKAYEVSVAVAKERMAGALLKDFSNHKVSRYLEVKDVLEDIWDVDANKLVRIDRLRTISDKAPATWTANDLLDMSLICCILWNAVPDPPPEPEPDPDPIP